MTSLIWTSVIGGLFLFASHQQYRLLMPGFRDENARREHKTREDCAGEGIGSSVVGFAIIWHVTLQTSSGKWVMLFTIASLLPQVLISPWAGVWADRYNRKNLIMLSDGFIALATLVLALSLWTGYERMELLLIVSLLRSSPAAQCP